MTMSKNILYLASLLGLSLFSLTLAGQEEQSIFEQANAAYTNGNYQQALEQYKEIEDSHDPKVLFNMGNCYYRMQEFARAILYYERSLKWGGPVEDIEYNLAKSRRFLRDELKAPAELMVFKQWKRLSAQKRSSFWAWTGLLLLWICVLLLLASGRFQLPTYALYSAFLIGFIALVFYGLAWTKYRLEHKASYGILLTPSVAVKSAPTKSATDLFIIHEGIKLGIEKEKEDWYQVSLPDGKKGWLPKEGLEEI